MISRDKGRILAEIKAYKPHNEIEGLNEVLPELEAEGYVNVWRDEQRAPISIRLTDKGQAFVNSRCNGKHNKQRIKANVRKGAKWFVVTLGGAVVIELATQAISCWLWP